jgi:hypothetical protein
MQEPLDEWRDDVDRVEADHVGREPQPLAMPVEFVDDLVDRPDERLLRGQHVGGM